MAGDWIKMRIDLGDDPSVIGMAAILGCEEDVIVGKLHRLWSWADRHTTDGFAVGINPRWVDRYVSMPGFSDALSSVKWVLFSESGVEFPNFDRHNGKSAKARCDAAIRQRLSRKNRDDGVTGDERTTIPKPFIAAVFARDEYRCAYCGMESDKEREASKKRLLSVDHVVPVSRGGRSSVDNLLTCCKFCNNEKNDRTPEEWGLLPTFLANGVTYESQKICDKRVTEASPEKRREEKKKHIPKVGANAPDGFLNFWKSWPASPRKGGKSECLKRWLVKDLESQAAVIVAHVEAMKSGKQWADANFIPAPLTYLNQSRWDGAEASPADDPYKGVTW